MRVTPDMIAPGTSDTPMIELADFLGTDDDTGIQVTHDRGEVVIEVDSLCWPSKKISLDPDDALGVAWLIVRRALEAKDGDFDLLVRTWQAARRRADNIEETRAMDEAFVMNLVHAFRQIDTAIGIKP